MQIHLILCTRDTVLQARKILAYRVKEITGKVPELQAVFLEQSRRRLLCDLSPVLLQPHCNLSSSCARHRTASFADAA